MQKTSKVRQKTQLAIEPISPEATAILSELKIPGPFKDDKQRQSAIKRIIEESGNIVLGYKGYERLKNVLPRIFQKISEYTKSSEPDYSKYIGGVAKDKGAIEDITTAIHKALTDRKYWQDIRQIPSPYHKNFWKALVPTEFHPQSRGVSPLLKTVSELKKVGYIK